MHAPPADVKVTHPGLGGPGPLRSTACAGRDSRTTKPDGTSAARVRVARCGTHAGRARIVGVRAANPTDASGWLLDALSACRLSRCVSQQAAADWRRFLILTEPTGGL